MQAAKTYEPSNRHFDLPGTFQEDRRFESGKNDEERKLIVGDQRFKVLACG